MIVRETGREFFPAGPTARPYHWPVILRCTKKLLTVMRPRQLIDCTPDGEDWYANLLWLSGTRRRNRGSRRRDCEEGRRRCRDCVS